jgi:hypothetical protein
MINIKAIHNDFFLSLMVDDFKHFMLITPTY